MFDSILPTYIDWDELNNFLENNILKINLLSLLSEFCREYLVIIL